jgi:lipoprotein-releasing system permease protein
MWFEFKVAWRFLKSNKTQTLLILLGIIVGVTVQIFLGSLISGLQTDLINQTVGSSPHVTVLPEDQAPRPLVINEDKYSRIITFAGNEGGINRWQEIENYLNNQSEITAVSPTINGSGFAVRGQKNLPIVIRGVDISKADGIYKITNNIVTGQSSIGGNNILIGTELANELELQPNDTIKITTSGGISDRFIVSGVFDLGSKELNNSWIFMSIRRASTLFNFSDQISNIEIQIEDVFASDQTADQIMTRFNQINAESWQRNNQQLLTALQSQSSSSLIIQIFVIIAVTLGIASVLAVSVVQKSRQIGILKAMGTKRKRVGIIFLIQGAILGLTGSLLGALSGIGLSQLFVTFTRDQTGDPLFPITVDPTFIIISVIIATSAGMIAASIPARNSAKLNPIEVIHNA